MTFGPPASSPARATVLLPHVEVSRVGTWNGDAYGPDDFNVMVEAFGVGFCWPSVYAVSHSDDGAPACGYVGDLKHVGGVLIADLEVDRVVLDAIRAGRLEHVSAEVRFGVNVQGQRFSRVLVGLALLGKGLRPAVSGLRCLQASLDPQFSASPPPVPQEREQSPTGEQPRQALRPAALVVPCRYSARPVRRI